MAAPQAGLYPGTGELAQVKQELSRLCMSKLKTTMVTAHHPLESGTSNPHGERLGASVIFLLLLGACALGSLAGGQRWQLLSVAVGTAGGQKDRRARREPDLRVSCLSFSGPSPQPW